MDLFVISWLFLLLVVYVFIFFYNLANAFICYTRAHRPLNYVTARARYDQTKREPHFAMMHSEWQFIKVCMPVRIVLYKSFNFHLLVFIMLIVNLWSFYSPRKTNWNNNRVHSLARGHIHTQNRFIFQKEKLYCFA